MSFKFGLKKNDVEELARTIPTRDTIAEKQGKRTTFGKIEDIENATVPWLRARRRNRPR